MIRFAEEYPKDLNGTQAAIRAGYSEKGAGVVASNLLKDDRVRAKIEELNKSRLRKLNVTVKNVLKEIALMAFSNIADVCTWNSQGIRLKRSASLSREETAAIKSITETITPKTTSLKVLMHDKPASLVLLCRYLNVLDGNAEVVDPEKTARDFKEAYTEMFDSVPTTEGGGNQMVAGVPIEPEVPEEPEEPEEPEVPEEKPEEPVSDDVLMEE
jgi:phage terminase small subunit